MSKTLQMCAALTNLPRCKYHGSMFPKTGPRVLAFLVWNWYACPCGVCMSRIRFFFFSTGHFATSLQPSAFYRIWALLCAYENKLELFWVGRRRDAVRGSAGGKWTNPLPSMSNQTNTDPPWMGFL